MGATQLTALRSLSQPVLLAGQLYAAQSYVDDIANDYQTDLISIVNQTATTLATNISQLTATEHALFYQQAGQVYRRTGDGQATQLTQTSHKIVSFAPTPDGTKIVFVVLVSDAEAFNTVSDRPQVRHYTKRRYKADGVGFIDEQRHFEVYVATIAGETRRLLTTDLPVQVADTTTTQALLIAQTTTEDADELRSALRWLDLETGDITPLTTEVAEVHEATIAPDGAYGDAFFWEFQRFTEAGYNVVFTNPHGSTTYGQDFINAVVNHYGEQDFRDVIAGLDVALQRFGEYIDANQQIIIGGSYGGFMTTWAIGHTSRFEAAISQRPVTEWLHLTGASDIGYNFVQDEMGANPYTPAGREELIKRSPITYAAQVKTPLLMLHGEYDLRTPIAQTEMYYTAIKTLTDTPVEMVRFPQAWHGVSRNGLPNLRETRLTVMFDWLKKTLA